LRCALSLHGSYLRGLSAACPPAALLSEKQASLDTFSI
jgi:hypothetical protein